LEVLQLTVGIVRLVLLLVVVVVVVVVNKLAAHLAGLAAGVVTMQA
jgi:hypothetical protein